MNGFPVLVRIMFIERKMLQVIITGLIGQDNTRTECTVGDVSNIFDGELSNHGGPYNGVTMGC